MTKPRFSHHNSLGALPPDEIAQYLLEIGDTQGAAQFTAGTVDGMGLGGKSAHSHTGMIVGFIAPLVPASATAATSSVCAISEVNAEQTLINKALKITLDKFYVHSYPGSGVHNILCEFAGKNQAGSDAEELTYTLRFNSADKSSPSVLNAPIFLGLNVGANGISFEGRTVNVSSSDDEALLSILDSSAFTAGLTLLSTAQPALKPLAGLAGATVKSVLSRKKNKQVHNFNLGLDFSTLASGARLRVGTYVVVQSDDSPSWQWDDWEWNRSASVLRDKKTGKPPELNYMAFGISLVGASGT